MGILDTAKDIAEVIQKTDNLPLMRQLITLQQELMAMVQEKGDLLGRIEALENAARIQGDLVFRHSVYWRNESGDGPFCSTCWDTKRVLVRLIRNGRVPTSARCGGCGLVINELPREVMEKAFGALPPMEAPGKPCPKCSASSFRLEGSKPDPKMGAVGLFRRDYRCSECGFAESRQER